MKPLRDAFELGHQHVALLGVQAELVDALLDGLRIEGRERRDRELRIVRARQHPRRGLHEAVPGAACDRVTLRVRPGAPLPADGPGDQLGRVALADPLSGALKLGPGVRLVPVHPAAAELDHVAVPVAPPGAAAEAVARLDQRAVEAGDRQLPRRGHAREASADHDRIEHAPSLADA